MYRIISFDGGGVKGVITARLLDRINIELNGFLQSVDLFAGTSTGSILAVTLAMGHTPCELVDLYRTRSKSIFEKPLWKKLRDGLGIIGSKYQTENRKAAIEPYVGNTLLKDIPAKVLAVSYQLDNEADILLNPSAIRKWKAKIFQNYPGNDSDGEEPAIDVILRSSAAPVFFPTYQGFIDGAVIANNPSLCALADALHQEKGAQNLSDIRLLSFGTGTSSTYLPVQDANWGLEQWGMHIINLMLSASDDLPDYQCTQLLQDNYHRLQPLLQSSYGIDSWEQIEDMLVIADRVDITDTVEWIKSKWLEM